MDTCPNCHRKLLCHTSLRCNWCGAEISDEGYREEAAKERGLPIGVGYFTQKEALRKRVADVEAELDRVDAQSGAPASAQALAAQSASREHAIKDIDAKWEEESSSICEDAVDPLDPAEAVRSMFHHLEI